MKIKVNHLTNLDDARFVAAAGADVLTFNFNRRRDFFISETLFKQMAEWLSVPALALDFGDDDEYRLSFGAGNAVVVEYVATPRHGLPGDFRQWHVGERDGEIVWLEYVPDGTSDPLPTLAAASRLFPRVDLFFNLDGFAKPEPHPALPITGISGRKVFSRDPLRLDYDAFEALAAIWKKEN